MAKKKYSYNDRVNYHTGKYRSFVASFEKDNSLDVKAMQSAEKKQSKMQYSDGFSTFASGIARGYTMPENELKKGSVAFQRGYKAGESAFGKAKNIKF